MLNAVALGVWSWACSACADRPTRSPPAGRCTRCGTSSCTSSGQGAFAPEGWVIACVSFDLLVAAYIIVLYAFGRAGRLGRLTVKETAAAEQVAVD